MRENTYRVWYEKAQAWVYFHVGQPMTDEGLKIYHEVCLSGAKFYQFTGLLDKNGKEIYEGDIVKLNNGKEDFIAPVVWHQNQCCFDLEHFKGYHGHWSMNIDLIQVCGYEVIGDIHTTPELLKETE
jgi:uncharacterized phage protein (TIGR01671 family)